MFVKGQSGNPGGVPKSLMYGNENLLKLLEIPPSAFYLIHYGGLEYEINDGVCQPISCEQELAETVSPLESTDNK